jgi:hypothetical protein
MCGQGMRMQVEKQKPKVEIKKTIPEESTTTFQCSTPFCNTQDPSSNTLCDECISRQYLTTHEIPDISPKKSSTDSDSESKSTKIDQTEWRCECCDYEHNLFDNLVCVLCQFGHRPDLPKSSSAKHSERSTTFQPNDPLEKSKPSAQSSSHASSIKPQEEQSIIRPGYIRIKF